MFMRAAPTGIAADAPPLKVSKLGDLIAAARKN